MIRSRYDYRRDELADLLAGEPRYRQDQVWEGLYSHGTDPDQWTNVPKALRARVDEPAGGADPRRRIGERRR